MAAPDSNMPNKKYEYPDLKPSRGFGGQSNREQEYVARRNVPRQNKSAERAAKQRVTKQAKERLEAKTGGTVAPGYNPKI